MIDADLLREAAAELYSADPDEFIFRRGVLAAQARETGAVVAAKQITGLRKPTRAAWTINQLVRSEPGVAAQVAELGEQLRAAQRALDGTAIRELSRRRRQLIDALAREAFRVSGQQSPAAALREEVAATLGAALADPRVAGRLAAGTLQRAARSDGFGAAGATVLTLVRPPSAGHRTPAVAGPPASRTGHGAAAARPAPHGLAARAGVNGAAAGARAVAKTTELAAVRANAERERHRQAVAQAEQAVAETSWALDAAAAAEREQEDAVRSLEERLADARHRLAGARLTTRQAKTAQRQARQALDRLRE